MMKKKILFGASFFVVAAVLLVACYEEMDVKRSEKSGFLTYEEEVTAAREFYEAMKPSKTRAKADLTTESGMIANMEPLWGKKFAYRRKNKKIRTVEAVMEGSKRITFMLPEVLEKYKETGDPRYKKSMTRLVVETDAKTGKKQAFTMTIVPDLDYLERTDFKPFYNTYVQRDKHFSGLILFHELDGFFANGWRYKDGKITHSIEGTTFSQEEIEQYKAQTRAIKEECGWVDYYQLVEECKLLCYKTEFTDANCEETEDCIRYWEYVTSEWECKYVEVPDGNNPPPGDHRPPQNQSGDRTDTAADCDKVSQIKQDTNLEVALDTLWEHASGANRDSPYADKEVGWIMDNLGNVVYPETYSAHSLKYNADDLEGITIDKKVHTHPNGFTPSFNDIYSMCHDFNRGRCSNEYLYMVVSTSGVVAFSISNKDAFKEFATSLDCTVKVSISPTKDSLYIDKAAYEAKEKDYNNAILSGETSPNGYIMKLINYFNAKGAGVNVMYAARNSEDEAKVPFEWEAKKIVNNQLINKCSE